MLPQTLAPPERGWLRTEVVALRLGPTPGPSQEGMASLSFGILKNHATGHVPSREGQGWVAEARSNAVRGRGGLPRWVQTLN